MTPTRDEINKWAAEACGWRRWDRIRWLPPGVEKGPLYRKSVPQFCSDRNALPELHAAIQKAERAWEMCHHLYQMLDPNMARIGYTMSWLFLTASPLLQTIAALKALGKWEDWDIPEETNE